MSETFFNKPLKWDNVGIEPTEELKDKGWQVGDKPPAEYFNYKFSNDYKVAKEIQDKIVAHNNATNNPHKVTKTQIGLSNVDNTSDTNKPISTATQAALDNKANKNHIHTKSEITDFPTSLPANGGNADTVDNKHASDLQNYNNLTNKPTAIKNPNSLNISLNGTSQGSYDGSSTKNININAASVGAAPMNHNHTINQITSLQNTLNDKANTSHDHTINQISDLQDTLNNKADTNHTHTKSQITDFPTALRNPESLKIRLRNIDTYYYDGSAAKTIDITADSVGAAKSKHTHSNATIDSPGFMSETDKSNLDNIVKRKVKLFYDKIYDGGFGEIQGVTQAKREKWFRIAEATPDAYNAFSRESLGLFMIDNLSDFTTFSSFIFAASSNYRKAGLKQLFVSKMDEFTVLRRCIPKIRILRSKSASFPSYLDIYIIAISRINITYIGDNWTLYESSNVIPVDDIVPDTHVSAELTFTDLYDVTA